MCIASSPVSAAIFSFSDADFAVAPSFSGVTSFEFDFSLTETLAPGGSYSDPVIDAINYRVSGTLEAGTASGFPAFALSRDITGTEFYGQGSSLAFDILDSADLSDGLQVSELEGVGLVFELNAREESTGRYHPPILRLNSDGTGSIMNSNNMGATVTNPAADQLVNVDFREEYVTELTFDPRSLTIATIDVDAAVPLPPAFALLVAGLGGLLVLRRRGDLHS